MALMQPKILVKEYKNEQAGYDIVLGVDISRSMQQNDFFNKKMRVNSSRIWAVKNAIKEFFTLRGYDRVGLVIFAEKSYPIVPLTYDKLQALKMLQTVQVGMAGDATAIWDGVVQGVKMLKDSSAANPILIILTDGLDNSSQTPYTHAVELAKKYAIKVYTIGIADESIDNNKLEEIAMQTNGKYFHATGTNELHEVYDSINQLEKSFVETPAIQIKESVHEYFVFFSIFCIFLTLLTRRVVYA